MADIERKLDITIGGRDESGAAFESAAAKAEQFSSNEQKLSRQRLAVLEAEAAAGSKSAGVEAARLRVVQDYARRREQIAGIIQSEGVVAEQRTRAEQLYIQLLHQEEAAQKRILATAQQEQAARLQEEATQKRIAASAQQAAAARAATAAGGARGLNQGFVESGGAATVGLLKGAGAAAALTFAIDAFATGITSGLDAYDAAIQRGSGEFSASMQGLGSAVLDGIPIINGIFDSLEAAIMSRSNRLFAEQQAAVQEIHEEWKQRENEDRQRGEVVRSIDQGLDRHEEQQRLQGLSGADLQREQARIAADRTNAEARGLLDQSHGMGGAGVDLAIRAMQMQLDADTELQRRLAEIDTQAAAETVQRQQENASRIADLEAQARAEELRARGQTLDAELELIRRSEQKRTEELARQRQAAADAVPLDSTQGAGTRAAEIAGINERFAAEQAAAERQAREAEAQARALANDAQKQALGSFWKMMAERFGPALSQAGSAIFGGREPRRQRDPGRAGGAPEGIEGDGVGFTGLGAAYRSSLAVAQAKKDATAEAVEKNSQLTEAGNRILAQAKSGIDALVRAVQQGPRLTGF